MISLRELPQARWHWIRDHSEEFAFAAAMVVAGAYLAYLLLSVPALVHHMFASSDSAGAPVLAETLGSSRQGLVHLTQPGYLLIDLWTRWLPGHRILWELYPLAMALLTAVLCGWAVVQVSGHRAGFISAAVVLAASPETLITYFAQATHGSTWMGDAVIFAFGALVLTRPNISLRLRVALCLACAVFVGFWADSGPLLVVTGMVPAATGTVVLALRGGVRRQLPALLSLSAMLTGATLVGLITHLAVRSAGWRIYAVAPSPLRFAAAADIPSHAGYLVDGALIVGNGFFSAKPINLIGALVLACAFIAAAASMAPFRLTRTALSEPGTPRADGRLFAGVYWLSAQIALVGGGLFTQIVVDDYDFRFLIPLLLAAACTGPLWASSSSVRRIAVTLAAAVFCLTGLLQLRANVAALGPRDAYARPLDELATFLEAHSLARGYAPQWAANSVSWRTHLHVRALPIFPNCRGRALLCEHSQWVADRDYVPRSGSTFVVLDSYAQALGQWVKTSPDPVPAPDRYGIPTSVLQAGRFTILVYPRDVASDFATP